jgi:uncharacterized protein YjiS (DUF1127 family)
MSQSKVVTHRTTTGFAGLFSSTIKIVSLWTRRSRERAALARLDPHLLRDIGLDPNAVRQEAAKPAWRD